MKKIWLAVAIISNIGAACAETTWEMASPFTAGGLQDKINHFFAKQVAEETKGKISINLNPGQTLFKHGQILSATSNDKSQVGEVLMSFYGDNNPLWQIDSLPFIADSYEKAQKLWDLSRDAVAKDLEKKNLTLLYAVPWPGQNFYTADRLEDIGYLKGKKLLDYNIILTKIAKELEAIPNRKYARNVEEGFKTGNLEAMLNDSPSGVYNHIWEYTKYYTKVNAFFPKTMVFVNTKAWNKLDESTQAMLKKIAGKTEKYGWELSKNENQNSESIMAEKGMVLEEPNKNVKQALFKKGQKIVVSWAKKADNTAKAVMKSFRGY